MHLNKSNYIKSNALAKNVVLNGSTIEQYPPPILYTPKKAITDTKKRIQYKAVDFFDVVMYSLFFAKVGENR